MAADVAMTSPSTADIKPMVPFFGKRNNNYHQGMFSFFNPRKDRGKEVNFRFLKRDFNKGCLP